MSDLEDIQKKEYEISFLGVEESGVATVEGVLAAHGGEIYHKQPASQMRLSYPISKYPSAYFGFFHFRALPEMIVKIKHDLGLKKDILRFLIITPPMPLKQERKPRTMERPLEAPSAPLLSNEALEQKLEEILK